MLAGVRESVFHDLLPKGFLFCFFGKWSGLSFQMTCLKIMIKLINWPLISEVLFWIVFPMICIISDYACSLSLPTSSIMHVCHGHLTLNIFYCFHKFYMIHIRSFLPLLSCSDMLSLCAILHLFSEHSVMLAVGWIKTLRASQRLLLRIKSKKYAAGTTYCLLHSSPRQADRKEGTYCKYTRKKG